MCDGLLSVTRCLNHVNVYGIISSMSGFQSYTVIGLCCIIHCGIVCSTIRNKWFCPVGINSSSLWNKLFHIDETSCSNRWNFLFHCKPETSGCSLTLSVDYSLTLLLRMIGRVPFYLYVVTDKKSVTYLSHYPSHL